MIAVVQFVSAAKVAIKGTSGTKRSIKRGLFVLLGISKSDTSLEIDKICEKLIKLRIFPDQEEKMNLNIHTAGGEILLISQFTLLGDPKGNNRPDFTKAADKALALNLYEQFADKLKSSGLSVTTGYFGEHMQIDVCLEGPITITLDSEKL